MGRVLLQYVFIRRTENEVSVKEGGREEVCVCVCVCVCVRKKNFLYDNDDGIVEGIIEGGAGIHGGIRKGREEGTKKVRMSKK
jgi:hypothetical protein